MGFPGTWMTESESVVYRVVPKCACSTIGQIMYYSDNGQFFDGDIHDATSGLHKWAIDKSQPKIEKNVPCGTLKETSFTALKSSKLFEMERHCRSGTSVNIFVPSCKTGSAKTALSFCRVKRSYLAALIRSNVAPSSVSRPAGTDGYHLMLSMASCGKLA